MKTSMIPSMTQMIPSMLRIVVDDLSTIVSVKVKAMRMNQERSRGNDDRLPVLATAFQEDLKLKLGNQALQRMFLIKEAEKVIFLMTTTITELLLTLQRNRMIQITMQIPSIQRIRDPNYLRDRIGGYHCKEVHKYLWNHFRHPLDATRHPSEGIRMIVGPLNGSSEVIAQVQSKEQVGKDLGWA